MLIEQLSELQRKVNYLETELANLREDLATWDRIFKENYWGMMICDAKTGELLKVNPCYAEMHGYSVSELVGKTIYDVFAPECHKDIPEIISTIHEQGHYAYNTVHIKKDGSCFPVHTDTYEVMINGRRLRVVSIWDITGDILKEQELIKYREGLEELLKSRTEELEAANRQLRQEVHRKETAEKELAKTNQDMINMLDSIGDGFVAVDREWKITYANRAIIERRTKNKPEMALIGHNFWERYWGNNPELKDASLRVMNEGTPIRFETFSEIMGYWVEFSIYPTESGLSIFSRCIEERKRMERMVEAEHRRLYSLFDAFPGLIYVQEEDYTIRFANRSFQERFGASERKLCYEVIAGKSEPCNNCTNTVILRKATALWKEAIRNDRIYELYAHPFTDVDGSKLIFKVLIDITDRKNSDRELARLERLNMVGEMAAGIAHEVRNPMTTVRGFLQLLAAKDNTNEYHEFYNLMIGELDRANYIITDFLSLARGKTEDFKAVNVSEIVSSLIPLIKADAFNNDIDVRLEIESVPDIRGNEFEIRQLLLNLARNGLEAMQGGKALTIQTVYTDRSIILKVSDQGSGIDPVILEKLGTPFLTTKERGTGLGLAICQSIASRHNATIHYDSDSNGTTVTVKFNLL